MSVKTKDFVIPECPAFGGIPRHGGVILIGDPEHDELDSRFRGNDNDRKECNYEID